MADSRVLTLKDKAKLEADLAELEKQKKDVTEEIQTAKGFGDLSENAEYDAAKDHESELYRHIAEIQQTLNTSTFVDDTAASADACVLGTVVRVMDLEYDEEDTYTLVGYTEADPAKLYISNESPIGEALMNHRGRDQGAHVGDEVTVKIPGTGDTIQLRVLEINRR